MNAKMATEEDQQRTREFLAEFFKGVPVLTECPKPPLPPIASEGAKGVTVDEKEKE